MLIEMTIKGLMVDPVTKLVLHALAVLIRELHGLENQMWRPVAVLRIAP